MKYPQCQWCVNHVASINIWGNSLLAFLKIIAGIFGNSRALIADGIHSVTDVFMSVLLYISLKISNRPADKTYPYGYGHIEFIAAGFIGLSLICVSIMIVYTSIKSIISGVLTEPETIALMVLILSIVGNELLVRYSLCVGKQAKSPAIIANAYENRADSLTSCAALIGVTGAKLGWPILDPLAAVVVGGIVAYSGSKILIESVNGMMDTSIEPEQMKMLYNIAAGVDGIKRIDSLVSRKSGQKLWIDMEITTDSCINLKEAKSISEQVKKKISETIDNIGNITVHLRPCRT